MNSPRFKLKIYWLLVVYLLAWLYQSWMPFLQQTVFANAPKVNTNIVALLVDKDLYVWNLKNSIDWYATTYIQSKLSNSRAVVFPLDVSTIHARDIAKMLENIYYEWVEEEPSTLKWVILVGEKVPLPVVNDKGVVFPTIFPYVDFDNPKYYRDPLSQYFLPDKTTKAQAEIRHSMIDLGDQSENYISFFEKLKTYYANPSAYVWDKMRYDDLIDQQESFNDNNLTSYLNKFLFAEDLAYHRYNPLLIDLLNNKERQKITDLTAELTWDSDDEYLNQVSSVLSGLVQEYNSVAPSSSENVPTVFVKDTLKGFQKSYSELYGISSRTRQRDNVLAWWRRDEWQIDSHDSKIEYYDSLYTKELGSAYVPLLVELNKKLEDVIVSAVKTKQYPMRIALPVSHTIKKHIYTKVWEQPNSFITALLPTFWLYSWEDYYYVDRLYEWFYYGRSVATITWVNQTNIFLWTPNPIQNNVNNIPSYTWFNRFAGIGSSYGISSQFVEANRWYVSSLAQNDISPFSNSPNICGNDLSKYRDSYWGWNTPLNLTGDWNGWLALASQQYDHGGVSLTYSLLWWPLWLRQSAGAIFNIAWSKKVKNLQSRMNTTNLSGWFLQKVAYQNLILSLVNTQKIRQKVNTCNVAEIDTYPIWDSSIYTITWSVVATWFQKDISVNNQTIFSWNVACPINAVSGSACFPFWDKPAIPWGHYLQRESLNYKTIDTLFLHTSPTPKEIDALQNTTPDRPIDSIRYLTFQWIGWNWINFILPNLYAIPIYQIDVSDPTTLTLKPKEQIEQTIRDYLRSVVIDYNNNLIQQINNQSQYFSTNTGLFNLLWAIDPLATPNRPYTLLDINILNNAVDSTIISSIAELLYVQNSILPKKKLTADLWSELEQIASLSNITNKKELIMKEYLSQQIPETPLSLPWYELTWYEVISLVSNGDDNIYSDADPSFVADVQSKVDDYDTYQNTMSSSQTSNTKEKSLLQESCASSYWEPVPLVSLSDMSFPWFKMFACWLEKIWKPKITFDFKNAQWPVLTESLFKDFLSDPADIKEHYNIASSPINPEPTTSQQKDLLESLSIWFSSQNYLLEEDVPNDLQPQLIIEQIWNTIQNLSLTITSTGTNCLMISWKNTCINSYITNLNEKDLILPVDTVTKISWYSNVTVKICNTLACVVQTYSLWISPWPVKNVDIISPYTAIAQWSPVPLSLKATDNYNNAIPFSIVPYTITTTTGQLWWGLALSIANFRDIVSLQGPIWSGLITASLRVIDNNSWVLWSQDIYFSPSKISVVSSNSYYNTTLGSVNYVLPTKKSLIYVQKDKTNISLFPQLTLDLKSTLNNQSLAGPIMLQSEQWLFDVVTTLNTTWSIVLNTWLSIIDTLVFENSLQKIIIQPKWKIWSDKLVIQLPDGTKQFINVEIRASWQPAKIDIVPEIDDTNSIINDSIVDLSVYLYDDRGNLVTAPISLNNESIWSLSFSWANNYTSFSIDGKSKLSVKTSEEWWLWYIVTTLWTWNQTIPWLWKIKVPKSILPKKNINWLYLNLLGTDRWKRDGKSIDELFNNSQKLLVTTTQIADPIKMHPAILMISSTGNITWLQKDEWIIVKRNNNIIAQNPNLLQEVNLWVASSFSRSSSLLSTNLVYEENHNLKTKTTWMAWSTNTNQWLQIIDTSINYNSSSISSVQDSNTPNKNIWRRHPDWYLTEFAQGKDVWNSTFMNSSEFLINYGDPLISRKDKNQVISGTLFDDWPWQMVLSNPTKTILKSLSIDVNNDGLIDIVTVFTDGSVVWSKQYWGKDIFVDMWPLLQIFGEIKDVYGVQSPDGFDEIMVENKNQQLKIYTNTLWKFDIDWFPVCFNEEQEDYKSNSLENIDQWFVEDMDNDWASDIVINQDSQIKIVYWAVVNNWHSFISKNRDSCDSLWRTRQTNHKKIVENLATQLSTWPIIDNSLIRWQWLQENPVSTNSSGDTEDTTISNNSALSSSINNLFNLPNNSNTAQIPDLANFPLENIVTEANNNLLKRSISPIDYYPVYETILQDNIRYITVSQLKSQDQVSVTKTYQDTNGWVLKKWDKVKVNITISWLKNDPLTYIDRIQWPWIIAMNNNGVISWRNAGTLPNTSIYKSFDPQDGFMFAVDNITLWSTNMVNFSYELEYQWWSSIKIKIDDRNADNYKDISIYPLDGCSQFLWTYTNTNSLLQNYRDYDKEFIDVWSKLENYHTQNQQESQNFISDITNSVEEFVNTSGTAWWDVQNILNNAWSEQMQLWTFLQGIADNSTNEWWANVNLDLTNISWFTSDVSNKIKWALQDLCNGSSKNSCGWWLPVPFNMSFLSPGTFNIMWCTPKMPQIDDIFPKDSWFPVFAFPATMQTPSWPLPMPFPFGGFQQWATDNFWYFWFPTAWGVYPSQIRIYLSPTTTQQMWMAICFWPQTAWIKLPKPFNAIAGNCIVTKVNLWAQSCDNTDPSWAWWLSDQDLLDLAEFGACTQPTTVNNTTNSTVTPSSPFTLVSYNSSNWSVSNAFPPGSYFWVVNFEKTPIVTASEFEEDEWVILRWGQQVSPQVQWASPKWLVACIVGDWMDRQTNYIINNFTNMQIWIYLPDLSQLWQWFWNIWDNISSDENNDKNKPLQDFFSNFWSSWDNITNSLDTFSGDTISQIRNYTINQSSLTDLSDGLNNPFDQLAKMFDQTPLIRINTMDVPVSIPMIYAEDIAKYESHLKTWIDRNKEISLDWTSLIQWIFGICGKEFVLSPNQASTASSQVDNQVTLSQLDDSFFNDVRQTITSNNTKLKTLQWQVTTCASQNRPNTSLCNTLVSTYKLTDQKQKDNMKLFVDNNITTTNACMNIIFQWNDINPRLKTIIWITNQTELLQTKIRENIKILDQYKRFPLQLYQWVHVVDRYLSELTTTIDNFLWYITLWLNTNATRFEQYVDAIITISTALQTRQAILNLSTDWQKKCSTCSVDNYDAYACSLWFVCDQLKLPILKLPPFKIPNIYIDLSHVDLSMDITLPKFQFIPTSVPLVQIPDLPQVPAITLPWNLEQTITNEWWKRLIQQLQQSQKINKIFQELNKLIPNQIPLSVWNIPILPSPPNLPELPSFIPNINLELPVLPPAPMMPKIAPQIEGVIKAVSVFSELYCIVKWWVWLVWESNIKTRIEQLTQRTNEIPLFDNINLSKDMSYQQDKLQWFDYKIDAYINFNLSFDGVYTLIKNLADTINNQTKKLMNWDGWARKATDTLAEAVDQVNDSTQQNINLESSFGYISSGDLIDVSSQKTDIRQVAQYLIDDERTPQDKKALFISMLDTLDQKYAFVPQKKIISTMQESLTTQLKNSRKSLSQLQKTITNYDKFIDSLPKKGSTYEIYSWDTIFSWSLFSGHLPEQLKSNQTILPNYIKLQKTLLWFYDQWLQSIRKPDTISTITSIQQDISYLNQWLSVLDNVYEDKSSLQQLAQTQKSYDAYSQLKYNNQAATCSTLWNMTNSSTEIAYSAVSNMYPIPWMTAQVWWSPTTSSSSSSYTTSNLYDFSSYKNKVMVPISTSSGLAYIDTLTSDYFVSNNKWYKIVDINDDDEEDILRRDSSSVWIKYANQDSTALRSDHVHTTEKYVAPVRSNPNQRSEDSNDWYIDINGMNIKLSSKDWSVKNLQVKAQDYDSFTIGWTSSQRQQDVNWYLIEISTLPDIYHLKEQANLPQALQSRYVLLLPEENTNTNGYLSIPNQLSTKKLEDMLTWTLLDIAYYKPTSTTINYSFTDIERAWYYTRVVSLWKQWSEQEPIYMPSSPRSHHIVAGQQVIADNQWPLPDVSLQRIKTNQIVDTGLSPEWFVNTTYNLLVSWNDPNGVVENRIETETWALIWMYSGSDASLSGLYFTSNTTQRYRISARDTNNNITREQLNLRINVPTITIEDIIYQNIPINWYSIVSSLSDQIDEWIVTFERNRNNVRTILKNTSSNTFNYPLSLNQTLITWWIYNQSSQIEFYLPNKELLASMNKEDGEISIVPAYNTSIAKKIDLKSHAPTVLLYDTVNNNKLFTIQFNTKNPSLQATSPYYTIPLSWNLYGWFAGGTCIVWPEHECIIVASPKWDIVIPSPYNTSLQGTYSYNLTNKTTTVWFQTSLGQPIGSATFNAFVK